MSVQTVFDLSPAEKLQLVQELWDDLAANPGDVPVAPEQLAEVHRRAERLRRDPASARSWEDAKANIRRRHARS